MHHLRTSLLAAACALACTAAATAGINESFDGAWVDTGAPGKNKGLMVDFIPGANTLFFAFFSYDNAGNQVHLVGAFPVQDGVVDYGNVAVTRVSGGRFSVQGAPTETVVGTADLSLQCDKIAFGFTPAAGSTLTAAAFDFMPSQGLDKLTSRECTIPLNVCPAGTTASGNDCALPASITNELILPAGKKYLVRGQVSVESGASLVVQPGVTVQGSTDTSTPNFIAVKVGGKIFAEGTPEQPITFTGPTPTVGSWSGLVIAGRSTCNDAAGGQPCTFEAVPSITYGGNAAEDNSGILRYVRIRWAGFAVRENEELNSLTLLGVGNGTVLDHVQVDGGKDDGFEFFGGSVNGRYLVCSNMGDDCFDFDQGYHGKIEYALAYQGENSDIGSDSNGVESDNDSSNFDKQPRTRPTISNLTLIGGTGGNEGMRLRRGSGGNYSNVVVTGYADRCINLNDAGTFALGTAAAQGEQLSIHNSYVGTCAKGAFEDEAGEPYAVSAWFGSSASNRSGDARLSGFLPADESPLLTGGDAPNDAFFVPAPFVGGFATARDNWTSGWTVRLPN
jgi:hypothetical protein